MRMHNNILKMYFLKAVLWFMVAMPIIVLFFLEHDLTLTQVILLQSIYSISVAFFEIPSGYIADVFGRRKTIIFSTIFSFMGYVVFSFYSGFFAFSLAQVLVEFEKITSSEIMDVANEIMHPNNLFKLLYQAK